MINSRRQYTADEIEALTRIAAESNAIDAEARIVMVEVSAILEANGLNYTGGTLYAYITAPHLVPMVEAMTLDIGTENVSYIPRVGDYYNSKWSINHWGSIARRARRNLTKLQQVVDAVALEVK